MKIKTIAAVAVTAIFIWHCIVWLTITGEMADNIAAQCVAGQRCTDNIAINPLTDNATITVSAPPSAPPGLEGFGTGFKAGLALVAEPLAKKTQQGIAGLYGCVRHDTALQCDSGVCT